MKSSEVFKIVKHAEYSRTQTKPDQTEEMIMLSGYPVLSTQPSYHLIKFYKGSGGNAARILNLDTS
jgi:hypothetical protein